MNGFRYETAYRRHKMEEQRAWINSRRKRHLRILAALLGLCVMIAACPDMLTGFLVFATEEQPFPDTQESVVTERPQVSGNTVDNDDDTEETYQLTETLPEGDEPAEDASLPETAVTVTKEDQDEDWTAGQVHSEMEQMPEAAYSARAGDPEAVWQGIAPDGSEQVYAGSFKDAVGNVKAGGMIALLTDVLVEDTTVISKSMTITSYDSDKICTIKSTSDTNDGKERGRIFTVQTDASFNLGNIILDGGKNEGVIGYHPLILVDNSNKSYVSGAGMNLGPGTILQNTENADASLGGGAVNIRGGLVRLYPDAVIRNCKAVHGGGVYINKKSNKPMAAFQMGGGSIEKCEAKDGGGVYINIGTFQMSSGAISDNRATGQNSEAETRRHGGGGIYIAGEVKLAAAQIGGGTIAGNRASNGGGILLQGAYAQLSLQGGTVKGNEANDGAGISVIHGNLKLYGGTVTGNKAEVHGGGVLNAGGDRQGLIELQGNPRVYGNTSGSTVDRFDNLYLDGNTDSGTDITSPIVLVGALTDGVQLGLSRWVCPDDGDHPSRDMIVSAKEVAEVSSIYTMKKADYDRLVQTMEEENKQLYADNMDRYAFVQYGGKIVMILSVDIALDKEKLLFKGADEKGKLKATVTPDNALIKDVTWKSSDESVAVVDENGVVTAVGEGEADITATTVSPYQATASCRVKVAPFYQVTTRAEHGEITYEPNDPLYENERIYIKIVADNGYQLVEGSIRAFKTGDESKEVTIQENNTFVMPDYDVTVTAEFEPVKSSGGEETSGGKDKEENKENENENENGNEKEEEEPGSPLTGAVMKQDGNRPLVSVKGQSAEASGSIDADGADASDNRKTGVLNPQTGNDMPIWYMLTAVSLIGLLFLGVLVYSWMKIRAYQADLRSGTEELEEIIVKAGIAEETADDDIPAERDEQTSSLPIEFGTIDFEALSEINEDIKGWIVCNGCIVNNPVVQTQDNSYYLQRSFMRKENRAGCIFMDYRNESFEDKNVVIYGHNTTDRTMFGSLKDVLKDEFWTEKGRDRIYLVDTDNSLRIYQIFSYYVVENEDYYITTSFHSEEDYDRFLKTIKARSQGECNVTVTKEDKILTLSTCYGTAGAKKRLAVHAKEILPPQR